LFGARVAAEILRDEDFSNGVRARKWPQVVYQGLSLLRETRFHKFQKSSLIAERELRPIAGKTERYQCRANLRRRAERVARNAKDKFGAAVEVRDDRKITVRLRLRFRCETKSDLFLNHDVNLIDLIRERKKMMKNRRRDVVRQIAVQPDAPARSEGGEIGFKHIAGNDRDIRESFREALEARDQQRIQLNRINGGAGGSEVLGHLAMAAAHFYPAIRWIQRAR